MRVGALAGARRTVVDDGVFVLGLVAGRGGQDAAEQQEGECAPHRGSIAPVPSIGKSPKA